MSRPSCRLLDKLDILSKSSLLPEQEQGDIWEGDPFKSTKAISNGSILMRFYMYVREYSGISHGRADQEGPVAV